MYRPRHTHTYCQFRKQTHFFESAFGQVVLEAAFTFFLVIIAGLMFFSA